MPFTTRLKTRTAGSTIVGADDDSQFSTIITDGTNHVDAANPHSGSFASAGGTITGATTIAVGGATTALTTTTTGSLTLNDFQVNGVLSASNYGTRIYSNQLLANDSPLLFVHSDNAGGTNTADLIRFTHDGVGVLLDLNQNGNQFTIDLDTLQTTTDVIDIVANSLTSANIFDITSTSLSTGNVFNVTANGMTTGNIFNVTANGFTSGRVINISSNSTDATARTLVNILNDNTAATGTTVMTLVQDAANVDLLLDQNANSIALSIESAATTADVINISASSLTSGIGIDIPDANAMTTGTLLNLASSSADVSTRNFIAIANTNSAANAARPIFINNDANGPSLIFDSEATTVTVIDLATFPPATTTGSAIRISVDSLTSGNGIYLDSNSASVTARSVLRVDNLNTAATSASCANFTQAANYRAVYLNASSGTYNDTALDIDCGTAAGAGYNFIRCSAAAADRVFRVNGAGQIYADTAAGAGNVTVGADYVCSDCGHSTIDYHETCPQCHSVEFKWNDDIKQFMDTIHGDIAQVDLSVKMGLVERKATGLNMNINKMILFLGFAVNQLMKKVIAMEAQQR